MRLIGPRNLACALSVVLGWTCWSGAALAQEVLVKPYVQPGPVSALVDSDTVAIRWLTEAVPAAYEVRYGMSPAKNQRGLIGRADLNLSARDHYFRYTSPLINLPLDSQIYYEVRRGGQSIRDASFKTRRSRTNSLEFVVVGDLADSREAHKAIAFRIWDGAPDFAVLLGDLAYERGRFSDYFRNFWEAWNNTFDSSPDKGAPVLGSMLTYAVIGNHDVGGTNLVSRPDGMAAFYFFVAPTNGPSLFRSLPPVTGTPAQWNNFRKNTGRSFPGLCYYSFDNGPAHCVVLDMGGYAGLIEPGVRNWLERDLAGSRSPWKFVFCHQPGFQAFKEHYAEQRLRMLEPLMEKHGVDLVFSGHVHNYQRSKPLRFTPTRRRPAGFVDGQFVIDEVFDGKAHQRPQGIIHIVSGAGGAKLHSDRATDKQRATEGAAMNWAPYTAAFVADRHSLTRVRVEGRKLHLEQVDGSGRVIDEIQVVK